MPSSYYGFLDEVVRVFMGVSPKTVLDIGVGFGKWGHLFREYGDIFVGRFEKDDWITQIDGVEIFEHYINAHEHQKYIYDNIYIGNIFDIIDTLPEYEFIYAGDVIEHLHREDALIVLDKLKNKASKYLVVCIPLGDSSQWSQGEVYGNVHESHLSFWTPEDFMGGVAGQWEVDIIKRELRGFDIGLFKIKKEGQVDEISS